MPFISLEEILGSKSELLGDWPLGRFSSSLGLAGSPGLGRVAGCTLSRAADVWPCGSEACACTCPGWGGPMVAVRGQTGASRCRPWPELLAAWRCCAASGPCPHGPTVVPAALRSLPWWGGRAELAHGAVLPCTPGAHLQGDPRAEALPRRDPGYPRKRGQRPPYEEPGLWPPEQFVPSSWPLWPGGSLWRPRRGCL